MDEISNANDNVVIRNFTLAAERNTELLAMAQKIGASEFKDLVNIALTALEWIIEKNDEQRIIAAIDLKNASYIELGLARLFPNLRESNDQTDSIITDYIEIEQ